MANLKTLKIGGISYNVGFSTNDLTNELKAKYDAAQANVLEGVQVDGSDIEIDGSKKVNINLATPIANAKSEAIAAGVVSMSEAAGSGDILKSYTFSQNGATIGTINLAKDLVVSGGEVVEVGGVKYLRLSIANQANPVDIAVSDLVDVYSGSAYIEVGSDNSISVKFNALDEALVAETAKVGAAIKAAQNAADGVRTDLGQKTDTANAEGTAFARIAQLRTEVDALGGAEGGIQGMIDSSIESFDEQTIQPLKNELEGKINAKVAQTDYDAKVSSIEGAASTLKGRVDAIEGDYLKGDDKTELQGKINEKVATATYEAYVATNDAAVKANTDKLAGISVGANKVSTSYDEVSATLTITIE